MYCPKCGMKLNEGEKICSRCGCRTDTDETDRKERICPGCGKKVRISRTYPYCVYCGTNLIALLQEKPLVQVKGDRAQVVGVEEEKTPEMPEEKEEEKQEAEEKKQVTCSQCGRHITITPEKPFCPYCGNDMSSAFNGSAEKESRKEEQADSRQISGTYEEEVRKKKKIISRIILCILAALCVCLVILLIVNRAGSSSDSTASDVQLNTAEAETAEPAETSAAAEETDAEYILPDSDKRLLTDSDVEGLSLQEINYAKNEIYARHGRKFNSSELQEYFSSKSWYNGTIEPEDFDDSVLSEIEQQNVAFLSSKEYEISPDGYALQ